jgi:uncharacterized protein YgbK (DUF1537 family)
VSRLGVIADDLTGALDTGAQLAKCGIETIAVLHPGVPPEAQAVLLSTDSRDLPASESYRRSLDAARQLRGCAVYKKIDSTLRGNVGAELDGVLDGLGMQRALVAPAFPAAGRTTVDGYHRVHGTLLGEGMTADDPSKPWLRSFLPAVLRAQARRAVGHLPLSVVDQGVGAVVDAVAAEAAPIVAADALVTRHLAILAEAVSHLDGLLPCGSAGLAEAWIRALRAAGGEPPPVPWRQDKRPVLVLAGSRNPATAAQLVWAVHEGAVHLVHLAPDAHWTKLARDELLPVLRQGHNVALASTFAEFRGSNRETVAAMLGSTAAWTLSRYDVAGLVLTGGDVARAVCSALGVGIIQVLGEVQAGVPACSVVGGPHDGLRLVTKAGGFGEKRVIVQSISYIQAEERKEQATHEGH